MGNAIGSINKSDLLGVLHDNYLSEFFLYFDLQSF